jgi:DNA modification methylase
MIADAILDCTARGEIVLDPCLGSGTSVIGAERTGRRCFGLEIDPRYVDTVIRRWQRYTGGEALHAQSSRSFNELEAEAEERNGK